MKKLLLLSLLYSNLIYCGSKVADATNPQYRSYCDFLKLKEKLNKLQKTPDEFNSKEWSETMDLTYKQLKYIRDEIDQLRYLASKLDKYIKDE